MYVIMVKVGYADIMVSMNDASYADYIMSGYLVVFQGTKKRCIKLMDDLQT